MVFAIRFMARYKEVARMFPGPYLSDNPQSLASEDLFDVSNAS